MCPFGQASLRWPEIAARVRSPPEWIIWMLEYVSTLVALKWTFQVCVINTFVEKPPLDIIMIFSFSNSPLFDITLPSFSLHLKVPINPPRALQRTSYYICLVLNKILVSFHGKFNVCPLYPSGNNTDIM